jgi:glycosyltransferase involved in cell wall biosynthesis
MEISIIIPTKNREKKLANVLSCLEKQSEKDFEVILVNDGKTSLKIPKNTKIKYQIIESNGKGVSTARNIGVENANASILLFMGDDIYPARSFVKEHLDFHRKFKNSSYSMIGLTKWPKEYKNQKIYQFLDSGVQFDFLSLKANKQTDIFHFYTSNLSMKKIFFEKFDENLKNAIYEDIELANRLAKKGLIIIYNPKALAIHDHFLDIQKLKERAFAAGHTFKYVERKIEGIKNSYSFSKKDAIKLFFLYFLKYFDKYKLPYYHYLNIKYFLKGYYTK